jgi:hypothetical protein
MTVERGWSLQVGREKTSHPTTSTSPSPLLPFLCPPSSPPLSHVAMVPHFQLPSVVHIREGQAPKHVPMGSGVAFQLWGDIGLLQAVAVAVPAIAWCGERKQLERVR